MLTDISAHESELSAERAQRFAVWLVNGWGLPIKSVLDAGCRCGFGLSAFVDMLPSDVRIVGMDIMPDAVERATQISEAVQGDILNMPFIVNEFDWVFCSHTLEHLEDIPRAVDQLCAVSKCGMCIVVPLESDSKFNEYLKRKSPDGDVGMHKFHTMDPMVWFDYFRGKDLVLRHAEMSLSHSDLYFIMQHKSTMSYGGRIYAPVCD